MKNGHPVVFKIETGYPFDGNVNITIQLEMQEQFPIRLRIPSYCRWVEYQIDGEKVSRIDNKFSYISLERHWKPGSTISLHFDLNPRVICDPRPEIERADQEFIAICRGPIVLARDRRLGDDVGKTVAYAPSDFAVTEVEDFGVDSSGNYLVQISQNNAIKMIDYASAGATWTDESTTECWMPVSRI